MKKFLLLTTTLLTTIGGFSQYYYAVSPTSDSLYTVNSLTGVHTTNGVINYNNGTISGFTGMAQNPVSSDVYAIVRKSGGIFELAMFNAAKDSVLFVGTLSDKFAGLTFSNNGVLYGITGDGANISPSTLYTINTSTAASTLVADLSATTTDGEAIAFNTTDGLIYRFTGEDTLQSVNPTTTATVNYAFTNTVDNYGHALIYNSSTNDFVMAAGDTIYTVSTSGALSDKVYSALGSDFQIKGLVVAPTPASVSTIEKAKALVSVFPNPSNGVVTIQSNENIEMINVYSVNGKLIESTRVNFEKTITKNLQKGAYLVEVLLSNNAKEVKNIIVK